MFNKFSSFRWVVKIWSLDVALKLAYSISFINLPLLRFKTLTSIHHFNFQSFVFLLFLNNMVFFSICQVMQRDDSLGIKTMNKSRGWIRPKISNTCWWEMQVATWCHSLAMEMILLKRTQFLQKLQFIYKFCKYI